MVFHRTEIRWHNLQSLLGFFAFLLIRFMFSRSWNNKYTVWLSLVQSGGSKKEKVDRPLWTVTVRRSLKWTLLDRLLSPLMTVQFPSFEPSTFFLIRTVHFLIWGPSTFTDRLLSLTVHFQSFGPSTFTQDRPLSVVWTVQFNPLDRSLWPKTVHLRPDPFDIVYRQEIECKVTVCLWRDKI